MAALSPEEETEKAQADFVRSAVRDVRYGPESLSDFTQWRVRMISEELVASGGTHVHEADIPERPPKTRATREPRARPVALKRPSDIPLSLSPSKRELTSPLAQAEGSPVGSDGSQLEPLHFLQCHSKNNSPRDLETQLWACAFEPAWDEGTALVGRQGEASGSAPQRELPGWMEESGGTELKRCRQGQRRELQRRLHRGRFHQADPSQQGTQGPHPRRWPRVAGRLCV